ncbi:MAG: hypothetical protein ABR500_08205 [Dermatophilaceae bacterium]|nr:hypothetical protein [Intrasporangiaceae bacterium]
MNDSNREDSSSHEDRHVDPTAPPPYPQEYGNPASPPPPPPPAGAPFGTPPPPPSSPYAPPSGAGSYGAPAYGTPDAPYGAPPPAYYQNAAPQSNTSALVLTIVSAIGTLSCCLPLPALILGIMALTKQTSEPEQSAKLAKYGWITFGVMVALAVVAFVAFMGIAVLSAPTTTDF